MDYALMYDFTTSDESDEETSENKKLFFMASALGHINRMKEFLDDGMDIETKDYVFGETIFIRACRHNHKDVLEFLHHREANVNAASNSGETALHVAAKNSSLDCLDYLISIPEVDKDYPDKLGQTPLMIAAFKGNYSCVEKLISAHCNAGLQDYKGRTALHQALDPYDGFLGKEKACACVQLLTSTSCDINCYDNNESTPLHLAVKGDNWKAVKILVTENCDLDKKKKPEPQLAIFSVTGLPPIPFSPFLLALNFLNRRVAEYLIRCGCSYYAYSSYLTYCDKDAMLYGLLQEAYRTPRSLKQCCRSAIRKNLSRPIVSKVHSFNLPNILQDYLLLKDENF